MNLTMYDVVFGSVWVKCAVWVLFAFLFIQPVAPAFANETQTEAPLEAPMSAKTSDADESAVSAALETSPLETQEDEAVVEASETVQEERAPVVASDSTKDAAVSEEASVSPTSEDQTVIEPPYSKDEAAVEEAIVEDTSEDGALQTPQPEEEQSDMENNEAEVFDTETEDAAITTAEATTTGELVLIVDHHTDQLEFSPSECASVGDGAFYCSTPKDAVEFEEDGVFAAPDQDGDREIFIRVKGEVQQLTYNLTDDNAPYFDALSNRIVWHANYHDRYQIMSYDLTDKKETRLTDTSYNNMEPVAYGDITMYQAWLDNNWEIMYRDNDGEKRLTVNTQHDVSPSIRGGYIVWQSQFADGWQVAVYDQETEHIEYVRSEDGAKVENPRFVLVYDSTNEAGDVQTLGYDFNNKRSFTLNSIPADLPDELPDPDQTGETRALIQNKQTVRDTEIEDGGTTPSTTPNATTTPQNNGNDIDLTASSTPQMDTTTPVLTEIVDVVIPSFQTATETPEISHISDVLIPPLQASSSAEVR